MYTYVYVTTYVQTYTYVHVHVKHANVHREVVYRGTVISLGLLYLRGRLAPGLFLNGKRAGSFPTAWLNGCTDPHGAFRE